VKHAARGTREVKGNTKPLEDDALVGPLREAGRRIQMRSLLIAVGLTALALLLPA
jgi:hypothetical protein